MKQDFQSVKARFVHKYLFSPECGINGIAETRLECMMVEGQCFRLREGESLDDKCISVSLLKEPPAGVKLEQAFEGVRVFYHICNSRIKRRIYVPPQ